MDFLIKHNDFEFKIMIKHNDLIKLDYKDFLELLSIPQRDLLSNYTDDIWISLKKYDYYDIERGILSCLLMCGLEHRVAKEKHLYFLEADNGLIKIGISNNVDKRIHKLESILKTNIKLLKYIPNKAPYEKILHKIYSNDNIIYKNQTEWFHPTHDLIRFISYVNEKNIDYYVAKDNKE
jgi:hypothetical protein